MTGLILFFSIAVGISFLCSIMEAVLLSVTHSYIAVLEKEEHKCAKHLRKLKEKIDHPLSAILTLNTIANTVGAAGVGAQTLKVFGSQWVAFASGILTLCILVFSEIIPKTIGASYWRNLAPFSAYIIKGFIFITYPIVRTFEGLSHLISPKGKKIKITREELLSAAEIGENAGALKKEEAVIIGNVLLLQKVVARDVMTPRSVIFGLDKSLTVGQVMKQNPILTFSRIPIFENSIDKICGLVLRPVILKASCDGNDSVTIGDLAIPVHAVPGSISVASVMNKFIKRREQLFLLVDEHGQTEGIITLEDAIETLLGVEIVDELDSVTDMRKLALAKGKLIFKERNISIPSD
jgi:CBS domain containing-hemolysin-like protein